MTVEQNFAFLLKNRKLSRAESTSGISSALDAVGLGQSGAKYPWQLWGGGQQRTAIARAIAFQPEILLIAEPFALVDARTRADLEVLMLGLKERLGMTIIFVTHDIEKSVYLGDNVVLLGGTPIEVSVVTQVSLASLRDRISSKSKPEFLRLRERVDRSIMR